MNEKIKKEVDDKFSIAKAEDYFWAIRDSKIEFFKEEFLRYINKIIEETAKEIFEEIEKKFSTEQFGHDFTELAKKYPQQVRYIVVTVKEWEELKKKLIE